MLVRVAVAELHRAQDTAWHTLRMAFTRFPPACGAQAAVHVEIMTAVKKQRCTAAARRCSTSFLACIGMCAQPPALDSARLQPVAAIN